MEKNRKATEEILLAAVGQIVKTKGFSGVGVNAVAKQAGVSKMLIYRYFDGLEGLIGTWILENSYWMEDTGSLEKELENLPREAFVYRDTMKKMFRDQWKGLLDEPLRRELLRWFIAEENPISRDALERIETRGREISHSYKDKIDTAEDIDAITAILIGGSYYLTLISDRVDVFNGVPLGEPEGQERLYAAMDGILDRIPFTIKEKENENENL
ncbi:MAG: TetR/AcrR family transcriptional regulator [Spirochaetales bacterium]|nr:TetR/AcrR family transcriptional regulator [Spirochaetales bacterium]